MFHLTLYLILRLNKTKNLSIFLRKEFCITAYKIYLTYHISFGLILGIFHKQLPFGNSNFTFRGRDEINTLITLKSLESGDHFCIWNFTLWLNAEHWKLIWDIEEPFVIFTKFIFLTFWCQTQHSMKYFVLFIKLEKCSFFFFLFDGFVRISTYWINVNVLNYSTSLLICKSLYVGRALNMRTVFSADS